MSDSFLGSYAGDDSRQTQDEVSVYRVTDYTSAICWRRWNSATR